MKAFSVELGGMSQRSTKKDFGVVVPSRSQQAETAAASKSQRRRRRQRIEPLSSAILAVLDKAPEISLADLRAEFARRGAAVDIGMLWDFFEHRRITRSEQDTRRWQETGCEA